ncbi:glycan-binding surface protein [Thermophagus sp. OGC60D27]|uniref:glycan-binding surface protein n=1 Tax=Thermophagus sp. OGC60D27 TaxID=3458415 RepID=UPI004037F541
MRRKILYPIIIALTWVALSGILLSSCDDNDESGVVRLDAFGPTPVLRGSDISFIGANLNRINSIIIPNNIEITDIEVISSSEIKITVPQNAEVGKIILNYDGGSITTKTLLGFSEPYEITSVSPADRTVRPGEEISIKGDYLNNIVSVIFPMDVVVDSASFISQSREEIVLSLPQEARSGKIIVQDAEGNQLYSDDELSVALPTISRFVHSEIKAGKNLEIEGENLDLVQTVVFSGGASVSVDDFVDILQDKVTIPTPLEIQDGTVSVISYSSITIESSESITTTLPIITSVEPETIFKSGLNVIIKGNDLEIVTSVEFFGAEPVSEFTYVSEDLESITVKVPDEVVDGPITIHLSTAKTIETEAVTFVKPEVVSLNPTTIVSGNMLLINGTHLDLVSDVAIGNESVNILSQSESAIEVMVPYDLFGMGLDISFTNINGTSFPVASIDVTETTLAYITKMDASTEPGSTLTIEGRNFVTLTGITLGNTACEYAVSSSGETLFLVIPSNVSIGILDLKLTSDDGIVTVSLDVINSGPDPILPSTIIVNDYEPHGEHDASWDLSWSGNTEIVEEDGNSYLRVTDNLGADSWIINCNHQSNGAPAPVINNIENYVLKLDVKIEDGVTGAENGAFQFIFGDQWNWYGEGLLPASTGGQWMTISIPVDIFGLTGTLDMSSGTNGLFGGPVPAGVSFDNLRFDLK